MGSLRNSTVRERQEVGRVAMRAHMVLLSDRGRPPSEIADLHAVSHPTVYKWIDRFDEEGPSGLYDREREGRPRELGKEARKEIERLLEGNPTEEGQNATRRTAPRIAEHLEGELGIDIHEDTVRDALNQMEYSWTRPGRKLPSTDPEAYRKRRQAIVEAVAEAGPEASVLAEDETQVKRFPPLRRQWQPVGEQRPVRVPEGNDERTLYGTLDLTSGQTHVQACEKGRSDLAFEYLESGSSRSKDRSYLFGTRPRGTPPTKSPGGSNPATGSRPTCSRSGLRKQTRWKTYGESLKSKWRPVWSGP